MQECHNLNVTQSKLSFKSFDAFLRWKEEVHLHVMYRGVKLGLVMTPKFFIFIAIDPGSIYLKVTTSAHSRKF